MAQWVKDPALSLLWLWFQLWHRFDSWPREFCILWVQQNKQTNKHLKKKKKTQGSSFLLEQLIPTLGTH